MAHNRNDGIEVDRHIYTRAETASEILHLLMSGNWQIAQADNSGVILNHSLDLAQLKFIPRACGQQFDYVARVRFR